MGLRLIGGRRIRWGVLASLGVVLTVLLGCVLLSVRVYQYAWVCDRETGGALAQFPAFGDAEVEPRPDTVNFENCKARYVTTAPGHEIIGYYRQQLTANGWEVEEPGWYERRHEEPMTSLEVQEEPVVREEPDECEQRSPAQMRALSAQRGDVHYSVSVAPPMGEESPRTQIVCLFVHVTPQS